MSSDPLSVCVPCSAGEGDLGEAHRVAPRRRYQQGCCAAGGEAGEGGGRGTAEAVVATGDILRHMQMRISCASKGLSCLPLEFCSRCPFVTCRLCKGRRMLRPGQQDCRSESRCWRRSECNCRRCVQEVRTMKVTGCRLSTILFPVRYANS